MRTWRIGVAFVLAAALLAGCGYSLRSSLPTHIRSVHVPVLKNRTQEPGIEGFITQALTDAVVTSGRVRVASNPGSADAVLEGSIVEYSLTSLAFDSRANVTQYRLHLVLALTFRDQVNKTVLWKQDRVEDRADFPVAGQVTRTLTFEETALRQAAVQVARAIVSFAFEGF